MKKIVPFLVLVFGYTCVQGQQNKSNTSENMVIYNASGGDALSGSGSVAYSLGSIFYSVIESPRILVCEGVQQAEMEEETVVDEEEVEDPEENPTLPETPIETPDPVVDEVPTEPLPEVPVNEGEEEGPEENPTLPEAPVEAPDPIVDEAPVDEGEEEGPKENPTLPKAPVETPDPIVDEVPMEPLPEEPIGGGEDAQTPPLSPLPEPVMVDPPEEGEVPDTDQEPDAGQSYELPLPLQAQDLVGHALQDVGEVDIVTYPNPVVDDFSIGIKNYRDQHAWYQLFDQGGRALLDGRISGRTTEVAIPHLSPATYVLRIYIANQTVKTLRILKK
ncbi:Por secretion system C-terminal sorting domain-containing protein [Zobellia uliginosa]|uniref:Por secretion system C-terminal sorting domain-containing protein n=1 Tax=Zobellia uliginosa TaxID=143224 RepID=A0ABY1KJS9_9FLAO|nr:T9SS type A sorting domain-containing protein [Zobellia uliginosa]SIS42596.1 Por secretion system C-terminal sorting domain-containing protein [Zobellia uliginosa]